MDFKYAANKNNVLGMMSRATAEEILKISGISTADLIQVTTWNFAPTFDGKGTIIKFDNEKSELVPYDDLLFIPYIEGVNVDWGFDKDYLADAFKIFSIFSDELLCLSAKRVCPLWIESYKEKSECASADLVILLAPRVKEAQA